MKSNFKKVFFLLVLTVLSFNIFAQDLNTKANVNIDMKELFYHGGIFSYIILALGVVVVILFIVKFFQLFVKEKIDAKRLHLKLKGYIKNQQYEEAIKITQSFKNTTLGSIFWTGITVFNDGKKSGKDKGELIQSVQSAFDEAGLQLIPKLDSGLFWFDIIAQAATLLGLLGTIWGLIQAFAALGGVEETMQQTYLTNGIYKAMSTTGFGLTVAIPVHFLKGFLQGRAEKLINEIDEYSVKLINQISLSEKG